MTTRDTQRHKVYKADHALDRWGRCEDLAEARRFVRNIWRMKRVQQAFPAATVKWRSGGEMVLPEVVHWRGRGARGSSKGIRLSGRNTTMLNRGIIVHELAHTVIWRTYPAAHRPAGHGWEFCDAYLKLTLYALGREAHDALKAAFQEHGVRFRKPRKGKPLSPERKAELVARLAAARAARFDEELRFSTGVEKSA